MTLHHTGWRVKTFGQNTNLLVDAEIERAGHLLHPVLKQPVLGGIEQCREDLSIIRRLDKAKNPVLLL
jgi:hypothetical protein